MSLRNIEKPGTEAIEAAEAMIRKVEEKRPWSTLASPGECDTALDAWLVDERVRMLHIAEEAGSH